MTRRRALLLGGAVACAAGAVALALIARDVGRQQTALRTGDVAPAIDPDRWAIDEALPFSPARRLLGVQDDLAYRQAAALFRRAFSRQQSAGDPAGRLQAEAELAQVIRTDHDRGRTSSTSNMLGILAFMDAATQARGNPTADRSILELQNAIRLDPDNELAKANLELVYQQDTLSFSVRGREQLQRSANAGASSSSGHGY